MGRCRWGCRRIRAYVGPLWGQLVPRTTSAGRAVGIKLLVKVSQSRQGIKLPADSFDSFMAATLAMLAISTEAWGQKLMQGQRR